MPVPVIYAAERRLLEQCLAECKRRLNLYRKIGDQLQADLAEADQNRMLDELQTIYRTQEGDTCDRP